MLLLATTLKLEVPPLTKQQTQTHPFRQSLTRLPTRVVDSLRDILFDSLQRSNVNYLLIIDILTGNGRRDLFDLPFDESI